MYAEHAKYIANSRIEDVPNRDSVCIKKIGSFLHAKSGKSVATPYCVKRIVIQDSENVYSWKQLNNNISGFFGILIDLFSRWSSLLFRIDHLSPKEVCVDRWRVQRLANIISCRGEGLRNNVPKVSLSSVEMSTVHGPEILSFENVISSAKYTEYECGTQWVRHRWTLRGHCRMDPGNHPGFPRQDTHYAILGLLICIFFPLEGCQPSRTGMQSTQTTTSVVLYFISL